MYDNVIDDDDEILQFTNYHEAHLPHRYIY